MHRQDIKRCIVLHAVLQKRHLFVVCDFTVIIICQRLPCIHFCFPLVFMPMQFVAFLEYRLLTFLSSVRYGIACAFMLNTIHVICWGIGAHT